MIHFYVLSLCIYIYYVCYCLPLSIYIMIMWLLNEDDM